MLTQKNENNKISYLLTPNNKSKLNFQVTNSEWKSKIKLLSYQYHTKWYPKQMILKEFVEI